MNIETLTPNFWITHEEECKKYFTENVNWDLVPPINQSNLINKKLVRFQGMIQDMDNPEYFYEKYEVVDEATTQRTMRIAKYTNGAECNENESIDYSSSNNKMGERQSMMVASIPRLNDWVEEEKRKYNLPCREDQNSGSELIKRPVSDEEASTSNKRQRTDEAVDGVVADNKLKNLPVWNKSCFVKVYDTTVNFQLNTMVDVIGFVSIDTESNNEGNDEMEVDSDVTPSIHCVMLKKITDSSPFVNETLGADKMKHIKMELYFLLTQLFMGDSVAAEYFIYHLISKVYTRNDTFPLGAFTLNISDIPVIEVPDFGEKLYQFIELLVSKSQYVPMTLKNMNSSMFIPQKDYETNKLNSGLLQLSDNTHLVLDETKLLPGRLEESGVKNVDALSNTIRNQMVMYDFKYYPIEYKCDIPFLVLSEGKSFLPYDYQLPLRPDQREVGIYSDIVVSAKKFLNPQLLHEIRIFLTIARHGTYEVSDEMQVLIQNDFVKMRQDKSVTPDDLHKLLTLARLVCLSEGKTIMDTDCWRKACILEEERKRRLQ